ncbi:MAG: hypothetical protein WKF96_10175 [Solirubrobacteraceae bacterium]
MIATVYDNGNEVQEAADWLEVSRGRVEAVVTDDVKDYRPIAARRPTQGPPTLGGLSLGACASLALAFQLR